jgi:predicted GNAT family acetyltransferase
MTLPELTVSHDRVAQRFNADVEGGHCGVDYRLLGKVMHIVHTEVPAALQGQGLAAQLVHGVLDQARALGWQVRPVCSYVAAYMRRHPETQDLLEQA